MCRTSSPAPPPSCIGARLPSGVSSPLVAFARTRSRSRMVWRGFSVAAMTEGVPGTCDVSILVRGSSFGLLVFDQAESAHDFLLFNHHRAMQWSHPKMQGDLPPPCRAHSATLVGRKIVTSEVARAHRTTIASMSSTSRRADGRARRPRPQASLRRAAGTLWCSTGTKSGYLATETGCRC